MKDQKTIDALRSGDPRRVNKVMEELLPKLSKKLRTFIIHIFDFYKKDIEDVMSETISETFAILRGLLDDPNFTIKTTVLDYWFGISKFYIYQKYRESKKKRAVSYLDEVLFKELEQIEELRNITKIKIRILEKAMSELGEDCRELIKYKFYDILKGGEEKSTQDLMDAFKLSTDGFARTKLSKCKKKLRELYEKYLDGKI